MTGHYHRHDRAALLHRWVFPAPSRNSRVFGRQSTGPPLLPEPAELPLQTPRDRSCSSHSPTHSISSHLPGPRTCPQEQGQAAWSVWSWTRQDKPWKARPPLKDRGRTGKRENCSPASCYTAGHGFHDLSELQGQPCLWGRRLPALPALGFHKLLQFQSKPSQIKTKITIKFV